MTREWEHIVGSVDINSRTQHTVSLQMHTIIYLQLAIMFIDLQQLSNQAVKGLPSLHGEEGLKGGVHRFCEQA